MEKNEMQLAVEEVTIEKVSIFCGLPWINGYSRWYTIVYPRIETNL